MLLAEPAGASLLCFAAANGVGGLLSVKSRLPFQTRPVPWPGHPHLRNVVAVLTSAPHSNPECVLSGCQVLVCARQFAARDGRRGLRRLGAETEVTTACFGAALQVAGSAPRVPGFEGLFLGFRLDLARFDF